MDEERSHNARRGFASLDPVRRREVARIGGQARQAASKDVQFVAGSQRARELALRGVEARRKKREAALASEARVGAEYVEPADSATFVVAPRVEPAIASFDDLDPFSDEVSNAA